MGLKINSDVVNDEIILGENVASLSEFLRVSRQDSNIALVRFAGENHSNAKRLRGYLKSLYPQIGYIRIAQKPRYKTENGVQRITQNPINVYIIYSLQHIENTQSNAVFDTKSSKDSKNIESNTKDSNKDSKNIESSIESKVTNFLTFLQDLEQRFHLDSILYARKDGEYNLIKNGEILKTFKANLFENGALKEKNFSEFYENLYAENVDFCEFDDFSLKKLQDDYKTLESFFGSEQNLPLSRLYEIYYYLCNDGASIISPFRTYRRNIYENPNLKKEKYKIPYSENLKRTAAFCFEISHYMPKFIISGHYKNSGEKDILFFFSEKCEKLLTFFGEKYEQDNVIVGDKNGFNMISTSPQDINENGLKVGEKIKNFPVKHANIESKKSNLERIERIFSTLLGKDFAIESIKYFENEGGKSVYRNVMRACWGGRSGFLSAYIAFDNLKKVKIDSKDISTKDDNFATWLNTKSDFSPMQTLKDSINEFRI